MHSTNYCNAFIAVADDCPAEAGSIPPEKADPTVAQLQFAMLQGQPYVYTSDDVIFTVYAAKQDIAPDEYNERREAFFAKGQPCLRSSPLGKRYGWGIHFDAEANVAIYARESEDYARLQSDPALKQLKAMKSAR
ncbi:MAG: DUF6157 family protein [Chloroflexaceae bacterium]|jgi:hypothetical protein|nr:DUF6157 family protein [Chloroflexaceae bacterium]